MTKGATKPPKKPVYKARLEANRKVFKGEGETLVAALDQIQPQELFKTRGTIYVEFGKLKAERFLYLMQVRRLTSNKIFRAIVAKNLELNLR